MSPDEDGIDLSKPMYVSLFGLWSKKSGYGLVSASQPGVVTRAVWLDKSVGGSRKREERRRLRATRRRTTTTRRTSSSAART